MLGILSRKVSEIPLFIGDVLYAIMIYFVCRILFIRSNSFKKIIFPLLFCYIIEIQQLYQSDWIVAIRNSTLGNYTLGEGFLWSDLVCYTFGVLVAYFIDLTILKNNINS